MHKTEMPPKRLRVYLALPPGHWLVSGMKMRLGLERELGRHVRRNRR